MHDALLISEVLSGIFDCLAEDTMWHPGSYHAGNTRRAGRRALAVLARTCRAFSEPALDALWHRLHSLEPFVQCLPPKASYEDATVGEALPPFNEEDWNIVSCYAPRVQELILERDPVSVQILQSLWFRTTLLLPNLRKLQWHYDDYTAIGSIRLLLSPSLVHLYVWLDHGDHSSVLGLLECYHTLCPNLNSLYFGHSAEAPPHVTAAISRAISRSPNLETLTCNYIDEAALIHIAGSRCLKKLTANLLDYQPDDLRKLAGCGLPDHPPFENLRALELRVEDLSSIIPYLKAHHQPFEEVSFKFRILPTPGVFHEFFAALSSATRRGTLRRITLRSIGSKEYGISTPLVDFGVLSPLMAFNLHEFDVSLHNLVSLNDDELFRLVQAWPELEAFYFNEYIGWEYDLPSLQTPTLRGLLLLLSQCPKLRALGMGVDARNIPSLTKDESLIRNMAITNLQLANSPIQEPVSRVTQFLVEHFPSLIARPALSCFNLKEPSHRRMWRDVNTQIDEINGCGSSSEGSDSEMEFV